MIERLAGYEAVIARLEGALAEAHNEIELTRAVEERMRGLVSRVQANEHRQEIRVGTLPTRSSRLPPTIRLPANDNPRLGAPEMCAC
jgi:uncharacterized coiled-coil protein SlyX